MFVPMWFLLLLVLFVPGVFDTLVAVATICLLVLIPVGVLLAGTVLICQLGGLQ